MKQALRSRFFALTCTALIGASLAGAAPRAPDNLKRANMTTQSARVEKIFAKIKPVCFGRFVIDVPETATVVFGRMTVDFEIGHFPGEASMADKHIAKQVLKLEKEDFLYKDMNKPGSLYGQVLNDGVPGQKTFIGAGDDSYRLSSYVPVGSDLFVFESNSLPDTAAVKKRVAKAGYFGSQLRFRAENDIPLERGICLEGGFISLNPTFENISMGVRLAELPDVHLSISTLKNGDEPDEYSKLEFRLKGAEQNAIQAGKGELYQRIKFLRRAPRQMGDWIGEEALARMPAEKGGFATHQFVFYAMGAANDILLPVADVQLDTGVSGNATKARPPSVTDNEAIAIWDRLTGSIRARPTTPVISAKK
ncbi:T6SS immunity protein Tli4 family protein [Massilia sp. S19_KUP03_FR1]|uniref:T6SS immunity protein Tli4 family protein n=1 Tax=Massilia sp. S19_KUP03_FR1 TaxID=3025503 RepID=UPI002FCDCC08